MKRLVLPAVLLILAWSLPAAAPAQEGTGADWPMYNGTLDSQRYSTLDQINTGNVKEIRPVWAFQTGIANPDMSFENTPIVVDGVMYVSTGNNIIYAMDAATGALKWAYDPKVKIATGFLGLIAPGIDQQLKLCCGQNSRGLAYHKGRIYMGTLDGRLIALKAEDGKGVPTFIDSTLNTPGQVQVLDLKQGYSWTAAPIVWDNKIFFGAAGSEYRTRGRFHAFDADTGKLLWQWYTIPAPNEPGGETWPNKKVGPIWDKKFPYEIGGVGVWMNPTIDVANRQVIFGTGNPNPDWQGGMRAGDNLYSCSVVSLDADTGKLRWHFQEVRHDIWDYDQAAVPILFTTTITGTPVEAVGAAGKTGWFYILDRKTGKPLIEMKEIDVPQDPKQATAKKQLVPATVKPFVKHKNMWAAPTLDGVLVSPGLSGGSEWSPISFDPKLNYAFVAAIDKEVVFCRTPTTPQERKQKPPTPAGQECRSTALLSALASAISPLDPGGAAIIPPPPAPQPVGAFIAIDVNTDKVMWEYPTVPHPIGGSLATAGSLVFAGEANGYFNALDAKTGKLLWRFQTGAAVNAAPMTYSVKGRQYVAVAAGGVAGTSLPNAGEKTPSEDGKRARSPSYVQNVPQDIPATPANEAAEYWKFFRQGGTVFVFALPEGP
jgi:PQQ-dependent dehydrogenase (methanol/ethanol family)